MVRFVIGNCAHELDQCMFSASSAGGARLAPLGIMHSTPCIRLRPVWPHRLCLRVTQSVHHTRVKLNPKQLKLFTDGSLTLLPGKINRRGVPPWRHLCTNMHLDPIRRPSSYWTKLVQEAANGMFYLFCPTCASCRDVSRVQLRCQSGWAHVHCPECQITSRSRAWQCECNKAWFKCMLHADVHIILASRGKKREVEVPDVPQLQPCLRKRR